MRMSRTARMHDTRMTRQATRTELWADFHEGQRVRTIDGIHGTVAAIEDGPVPGAEAYRVTLDHGLGGGLYTTSQLSAAAEAHSASEHHTADQDYPELGTILEDRPNIAPTASRHPFVHEAWGQKEPADLGPDWTHQPGNKEFGEEPSYVHHDMDREVTKTLTGDKHGWSMHAQHWCGYQQPVREMTVPKRSGGQKPVSKPEDAVAAYGHTHMDKLIDDHVDDYHNEDKTCRYDLNESHDHNILNNYKAANYHREIKGLGHLPGSRLTRRDPRSCWEPHPDSPGFEQWHDRYNERRSAGDYDNG